MDNFDLKKYLIENRVNKTSSNIKEYKTNSKYFTDISNSLELILSTREKIISTGDEDDINRMNKIFKNFNMEHLMKK